MDTTIPVVKEEPRVYTDREVDDVAPRDVAWFNQSRFHKYQNNPVFPQIRHQFTSNDRREQGVASNTRISVSRNDTLSAPNTAHIPLGPRMVCSSRRDIVENWLSSYVHTDSSSTDPDHHDGDSEHYFQTPIDIPTVVSEFKATLENYGISQRFAARYIMEETSQGNLSFLLDKGRTKKWGELSHRGRLPYIRMKEWLDNKDLQMATMEMLKGVKAIKKSGQKEASNKREKFSLFQLSVLCRLFEENSNPSMGTRMAISEKLNIHIERINVWFQNQRARGFPAKKILEQSFGGLLNKDSKKQHQMQPNTNFGLHFQPGIAPFQGSTLPTFSSDLVKESTPISDLDLNAICGQPSLTRSSIFGTPIKHSKSFDVPGLSMAGNSVPADLLNTPLSSNQSLFSKAASNRVKVECNTIPNSENIQASQSPMLEIFTKYLNKYGETRSLPNPSVENNNGDSLFQSNSRSENVKRSVEMPNTSEGHKKPRVNVPFFRGKGSHTVISPRHRSVNDSSEGQQESENTTVVPVLTRDNQGLLAYMQMSHSSMMNGTITDIPVSETVMSPGTSSMTKLEKTNATHRKLPEAQLLDISAQALHMKGVASPHGHFSETLGVTSDTRTTFNKQNHVLSGQTHFGSIASDAFGIHSVSAEEKLSSFPYSQAHSSNVPSDSTRNNQIGVHPTRSFSQTFTKTTTAAKQIYPSQKATSLSTMSQSPVTQTSVTQFQLSQSSKSQVSGTAGPKSHPIEDLFQQDSTLHVIKLLCTQILGNQSSPEIKELEIPDLD
ncbi:hypothetical protein CHS0354_012099 [Potamilus streckersoni]|uniref:One cut domain family member n=1 Tax=Potamilus streckersoni TaxID=2493646 RepID=A0AAE0SAJ6_9BIVA|nr:hypothetical protein CHS0354_012099 [Potamilus streckersoni]